MRGPQWGSSANKMHPRTFFWLSVKKKYQKQSIRFHKRRVDRLRISRHGKLQQRLSLSFFASEIYDKSTLLMTIRP